jgi:hypothetical protein
MKMGPFDGYAMAAGMLVFLTLPLWYEKLIAEPHNERMRRRHPELVDVLTFTEKADRSGILP